MVISMSALKKQISLKSERLEARISPQQKKLFQQAANLSGRSLTDFAIEALQETAMRIIQEHNVLQLSLEDQKAFIKAIFNPPAPSKNLIKAAKRHKKEVES